jgi:hypothetical protein
MVAIPDEEAAWWGGWVNLSCDLCGNDVERGVCLDTSDEYQGPLVCAKCLRGMAKLLKESGGPTP